MRPASSSSGSDDDDNDETLERIFKGTHVAGLFKSGPKGATLKSVE